MPHTSRLLQQAEAFFLKGDYKNALQVYGLLLKQNPTFDEAKVGVFLSDLGLESEDEAQALFDYYHVIKDEQSDALSVIQDIIESFDASKHTMSELLAQHAKSQIEYEDGILYSDFQTLIESRGGFRQAFEDIMFSTKVIITEKDDFIDFITKLSQEGFKEMALSYLESTASAFGNDQKILSLYSLLDKDEA